MSRLLSLVPALVLITWGVLTSRGFTLEVRALKETATSEQPKHALAWGLRVGCWTAVTLLAAFFISLWSDISSGAFSTSQGVGALSVMVLMQMFVGVVTGLMIALLAVHNARASVGV